MDNKPTTLVACAQCGRGWPPRSLIGDLCLHCVSEQIHAQARIAALVEARGYRTGWEPEQFAARQCCKLVEELGELAWAVCGGGTTECHGWLRGLLRTADCARDTFDMQTVEWDCSPDVAGAMRELADVQVVIFCLAAILGEMAGERFDVVRAALEKASADVRRGTRNQEQDED